MTAPVLTGTFSGAPVKVIDATLHSEPKYKSAPTGIKVTYHGTDHRLTCDIEFEEAIPLGGGMLVIDGIDFTPYFTPEVARRRARERVRGIVGRMRPFPDSAGTIRHCFTASWRQER